MTLTPDLRTGQYNFTTIDAPGATSTGASGINDEGQVVGAYNVDLDGVSHVHGFVDTHGTFTTIDAPGAIDTYATAINALGQVTGYYTVNGGSHGFLKTKHGLTTIDAPGAQGTNPHGINDFGQIVGTYADQSLHMHAFLDTRGRFTELSVPGSAQTFANGINDFGQIVGSYIDQQGSSHGFLFNRGHYTTIDVAGSDGTVVWSINNRGQISGDYTAVATAHGFVEAGGKFTTVDAPGADQYTHALGLNDLGQIAGQFGTSEVQGSFVATPRFIHGGTIAGINASAKQDPIANVFGTSDLSDLLPQIALSSSAQSPDAPVFSDIPNARGLAGLAALMSNPDQSNHGVMALPAHST